MITIEEINSNDERIVEEKVIKYRQKLQQRNIDLIATRKQNRQEAETAQREARAELPTSLEEINSRIQKAINKNARKVEYYCGSNDDITAVYLSALIMQVMSLEGFVCSQNYSYNNKLCISW